MSNNYVIFSQRAFNAIVTEVIEKHPIETGGILIGYVLNNGAWVVVEHIPPGYNNTIHQRSYFEYDADFINYLSNVVGLQYKGNLQILGLWHRHPGSMDYFSSTDDGTNYMFAHGRECGAISGLVNCDPKMRLTMYHVKPDGSYEPVEWYVDDGETIPQKFLELRFTDEESLPTFDMRGVVRNRVVPQPIRINQEDETPVSPEPVPTSEPASAIPESAPTPEAATVAEVAPVPEVAEAATECTSAPYSMQDAITDFKSIIRKLVKG